MQVQSLGPEDSPEEEMATHSSVLAWRIPRTEEPGGLQSVGSQSLTRLKRLSVHARRIASPTHGHEFAQTPGDSGGQRSLACFSP